jgi:hypothetical protein
MDGVITSAATFIEGMRSNSEQPVAVISDQAFSAFIVQGEFAQLMNPGDRFEMTLGSELYMMEVVDPDEYGFIRAIRPDDGIAEAFLAFLDAPPEPGFDTFGRVHMPLDEASNVLYIPVSVLRRFEGRDFVYVLEDGVRKIRDVVAGLEGGGLIEIKSGLNEGESIIV